MPDDARSRGPTGGRRALVIALAALLTLLGIELGARVIELAQQQLAPRQTGETAFAVLANPVSAFERVAGEGGDEYVRTKAHWIPRTQRFAARKPENGLRIFSLGGSAALGWPHGDPGSYARILEQKLHQLYPDRRIEVVNAAGNTYASLRVKVVFDEIIDYEPDLVLLWSGNNEFLEDVVYGMIRPPWPWRHSALARILHVASGRARAAKPIVDIENYLEADLATTRIGFAFGKTNQLREDPAQLERVADHYRHNLEAMLRTGGERGIPIVLIDVPVNLKDWWPNVSAHRANLSEAQRARFQTEFREGVLALEGGRAEAALAALDRASAIDAGYAEIHFLRGRALQRLGRRDAAIAAYRRALEEDAHPFRDIPRFASIRRDLAGRFDVPLVDAPGALAALAEDGIPGHDVLVDYVHPTVLGNDVIAHEVLLTASRAGLLPPDRAVPLGLARVRVPPAAEDDLRVLLKLYPQYLIMRQYEGIEAIAQRIRRATRPAADDSPEVARQKQQLRALIRDAGRVLEPYQKLLRAEKLGTLEQEFTPKRARLVYRAYVDLIRQIEARELTTQDFEALVPAFEYRGGTADRPD